MKTDEELNALKEEVKTMNKKLAELTEDELAQVSGGGDMYNPRCPNGRSFNVSYAGSHNLRCRICGCLFIDYDGDGRC